MADRKQRFGLVAYFEKVQKTKYGTKVAINRYSGQWDADAILESYGIDDAKKLVDRYFEIAVDPSWKRFVNTAEKVYAEWTAENEDKRQRKIMRDRMEAWLRE